MTAPDISTTTRGQTSANGALSLIMGVVALFGLPARPLMKLIVPTSPAGLFLTMLGLQLLLAAGAVILGLRSNRAADGHRPASANAGIALGGITLSLCTILAIALTFNYVSNSMDRSVIETEPVVLQPAE